MTPGEYKSLRIHEAIGRNVRLLREVRNGDLIIPADSICTIAWKRSGGFNLVGPKCELCGIQVKVEAVPCAYVQLVDEEGHYTPEEIQGRVSE